jgi:hypothetical protein
MGDVTITLRRQFILGQGKSTERSPRWRNVMPKNNFQRRRTAQVRCRPCWRLFAKAAKILNPKAQVAALAVAHNGSKSGIDIPFGDEGALLRRDHPRGAANRQRPCRRGPASIPVRRHVGERPAISKIRSGRSDLDDCPFSRPGTPAPKPLIAAPCRVFEPA